MRSKKNNNKINKILLAVLSVALIVAFGWLDYRLYKNNGQFLWSSSSEKNAIEYPNFRNDIRGQVVADLTDENDNPIFYVLRFYDTSLGGEISDLVTVPSNSVYIDEDGTMSIQVIDDTRTGDGEVYASVHIGQEFHDESEGLPEQLLVGDPCILSNEVIILVCDYYTLDIAVGSEETDEAAATEDKIYALNYQVKGLSITKGERMILAGGLPEWQRQQNYKKATEQNQPKPKQPAPPPQSPKPKPKPHKPPTNKPQKPEPKKKEKNPEPEPQPTETPSKLQFEPQDPTIWDTPWTPDPNIPTPPPILINTPEPNFDPNANQNPQNMDPRDPESPCFECYTQ